MPTATRNPRARRDKLTWGDVVDKGRAGRWRWIEWAGHTFTLDAAPLDPSTVSQPPHDNEIRVIEHLEEMRDGTLHRYPVTRRGILAPPGSFEAAVAADAKRKRRRTKPSRPVDMLQRLPALAGRPEHIFVAPSNGSTDILADAVRLQANGPVRGAYVPGKPAPQGPAAIIDRLRKQGVEVSLSASGRLLATAPDGRCGDGELRVLRQAERLIVAFLSHVPLFCEVSPHAPAVPASTIVAVDVPSCLACAKAPS